MRKREREKRHKEREDNSGWDSKEEGPESAGPEPAAGGSPDEDSRPSRSRFMSSHERSPGRKVYR